MVPNVISFKRAFQPEKNSQAADVGRYPLPYIHHFNGFLMDICNCVWRNRAFAKAGPDDKKDPNALGCTLPETVITALKNVAVEQDERLASLFSLSHSATLSRLSADCFRDIEVAAGPTVTKKHKGPVTSRSLVALGNVGSSRFYPGISQI